MQRSTVRPIDELQASRGGAKALLLTILGEFVLPAGGQVWTSTLVSAADALGIGEKNARQAIARIRDDALIDGVRHGRTVRWSLTPTGRNLLETGAQRIYDFGSGEAEWSGEWLLAHCQVPEAQRARRQQLRTQLGFLGFGELSASLLISPHVDREPALRQVLGDLDLLDDSVVLRSISASRDDDIALVRRAWDLDALAADYGAFMRDHGDRRPVGLESTFAAVVDLVHDWRGFLFTDPDLPAELLPAGWAGIAAASMFRERRAEYSPGAQRWFAQLEAAHRATS